MGRGHATHEVFNQPPPLRDGDLYADDAALREAVSHTDASGWAPTELHLLGTLAATPEVQRWGEQANANPPVLRAFDRYGHRIDQVEYHPAYHELMAVAVDRGLHGWPWAEDRPGAHAARAAGLVVWSQVDAGHTCPISMTYAAVAALRHDPELAAAWEPGLTVRAYDPRFLPPDQKLGLTCGMGMTEKQGGSDVRANTTRAQQIDGREYLLTGHKWFCSAPMSDAFLVLAQAPGGLSCFLVPRWRPDGTPNVLRIQRLKDKLGDRSNASSEVELDATWAQLIGEEGRGVRTIIDMVNRTRLDCALGATAILRQGVAQATWHARHRWAFGARLADQPLMGNVLADLAVESEAATFTALWLAELFDADPGDERAVLLQRLALPIVKYWLCKRAPVHAAEALECLGGAGYVEESGMPRLFRQSPLNGIWEGSGNVMCLDVFRAMARNPQAVEVLLDEVELGVGANPAYDAAVRRVQAELVDIRDVEWSARAVVERLALVLQAGLLLRRGAPAVAAAFCASRLDGASGRAFGTLPLGVGAAAIVARHTPAERP